MGFGKHGNWLKNSIHGKVMEFEKMMKYHGKIMEFCYEMPVWMSFGLILFLVCFARSISIDK